MIKIFECGLCDKFKGIREKLREHLRENHNKRKEIANFKNREGKLINQPWWKWRELKCS